MMTDFGGKKCVVGADGTPQAVDLTPEEINQRNIDTSVWQGEVTASQAAMARYNSFVADPDRVDIVDKLKNASPDQINTYIDNNVSNLADARAMLKKIVKVLAIIVKK